MPKYVWNNVGNSKKKYLINWRKWYFSTYSSIKYFFPWKHMRSCNSVTINQNTKPETHLNHKNTNVKGSKGIKQRVQILERRENSYIYNKILRIKCKKKELTFQDHHSLSHVQHKRVLRPEPKAGHFLATLPVSGYRI